MIHYASLYGAYDQGKLLHYVQASSSQRAEKLLADAGMRYEMLLPLAGEFIARSPTDVRALIDRVRELEVTVARVREVVDFYGDGPSGDAFWLVVRNDIRAALDGEA